MKVFLLGIVLTMGCGGSHGDEKDPVRSEPPTTPTQQRAPDAPPAQMEEPGPKFAREEKVGAIEKKYTNTISMPSVSLPIITMHAATATITHGSWEGSTSIELNALVLIGGKDTAIKGGAVLLDADSLDGFEGKIVCWKGPCVVQTRTERKNMKFKLEGKPFVLKRPTP